MHIFSQKICVLDKNIINFFASCKNFGNFFCTFVDKNPKKSHFEKSFIQFFRILKEFVERFSSLLKIKYNESFGFYFDQKRFHYLHVCCSKTSEKQCIRIGNISQSHQKGKKL